jgi:hypothetical protein
MTKVVSLIKRGRCHTFPAGCALLGKLGPSPPPLLHRIYKRMNRGYDRPCASGIADDEVQCRENWPSAHVVQGYTCATTMLCKTVLLPLRTTKAKKPFCMLLPTPASCSETPETSPCRRLVRADGFARLLREKRTKMAYAGHGMQQ